MNRRNVGTNSTPIFPPETKGTFLQRRHILQSKLSEDLGLTIFGRHLVFTPLLTNILLVPPLSLLIPNLFREYYIFGQCVHDNHGERTNWIEWTLCCSQDVRRGERWSRQFNRVSYSYTSIFCGIHTFYISQVEDRNEPTNCKMVGLTIVGLLLFFFAIYLIIWIGWVPNGWTIGNSWFSVEWSSSFCQNVTRQTVLILGHEKRDIVPIPKFSCLDNKDD